MEKPKTCKGCSRALDPNVPHAGKRKWCTECKPQKPLSARGYKRICCVDSCDRPALHSRKLLLCKEHWSVWGYISISGSMSHRWFHVRQYDVRSCPQCGDPFLVWLGARSREAKVFCKPKCAAVASAEGKDLAALADHLPDVARCNVDGCNRLSIHVRLGLCGMHYGQRPEQRAREKAYRQSEHGREVRRIVQRRRDPSKIRRNVRAWEERNKDWGAWWAWQRALEDRADLKAWRARNERRARRIRRATRPLPEPRQFIAGSCPDCGKNVVVVRGWWHDSIRCPRCTKRRWQQTHRQRAKFNGVEYEDIPPVQIFKRDGWRCQICGRKTSGRFPAPLSPTLDHIIPISRGGPHLAHNLQTAHLRCNVEKHDGSANDQLRLAVD